MSEHNHQLDEHLEAEHTAPRRTLPQGTQLRAVDHGHEERDVRYGSVVAWFSALALLTAVVFVFILFMFQFLLRFNEERDRIPSPIFTERTPPPAPRLLPNRIDDPPDPRRPLRHPTEYGTEERDREARQLRDLGLADPQTGLPTIPPEVAASAVDSQGSGVRGQEAGVRGQGSGGGGRLGSEMPSEASGGTTTENRLN